MMAAEDRPVTRVTRCPAVTAELSSRHDQSPRKRSVTLGLVQHQCAAEPDVNMRKAVQGVRDAAARGAQIVCLQELFRSQYFCQVEDHRFFDLAEPIPGPSTETLAALAAELGVVIVASLFEKRAEGLYHNTAAIIDADGRYLGKYRKMHIPDDPQYYEKFYFTPGDLGFRSWDTRFGRIGVLRLLGPVVPGGRPAHRHERRPDPVLPHRHRMAPAGEGRARRPAADARGRRSSGATRSPTACTCAPSNRVGHEGDPTGGIEFWGGELRRRSRRADPGEGRAGEEVLTATVDLGKVGREPHALAVPARPADRRVPGYHQAVSGLASS